MMAILFDIVLGAMLVLAALAVVGGGQGLRAVAFFVVFGVLMALAWLRLDAIDVALAEAAMGAGLTGVLLLGAQARLRRLATPAIRVNGARRLLSGSLCVAFFWLLVWTTWQLPGGGGLQGQVAAMQGELGTKNPVTAVLLGFRAFDTLMETVVLLAALLGTWVVAADNAWGEAPGQVERVKTDGVLHVFGRLLPPLALLLGVYWIWIGSDQPGGAFQGGTVLAAGLLLLVMSGHWRWPRADSPMVRFGLVSGPAWFLLCGLGGLALGSFLQWPTGLAKPLILAIECVLAIAIALTLALLVAGPPRRPGDTS